MASYKIFKETTLPGSLEANAIYLVAPASKPDYVEIYVTGVSAATVRRVIDSDDVQAIVDAAIDTVDAMEVVADIAERDALTPDRNITCLVIDATDDVTVASGGATYAYKFSTTTWYKISETESMDLTFSWASLTGKPSSSAAAIDSAVSNSHSHSNIAALNKITEDVNGKLLYDGAHPVTDWNSTNW